MRGLRSTIALLVVLVGLCAYIYFVLSKKPEGGAEAKERVFVSLDADTIDEIKVKSESGDTTTVKKTDGMWQMTAPLTVKADAMQASAIATNLSTLEITRVVDENPADLKEYGLDSPRVEIEFKASGNKSYADAHRLFLGGKSATGGDLFARRDADKRVILVAGYTDSIFNRATFDLRDKTLLAFEHEKVDRIDISGDGPGTTSLALAKEGTDWKLTKPTAALADFAAVDALISRVQGASMKSIVTEQATPADLKKYGFDKPQAMAVLTAGGTTTASLVVGAKATGEDVYVRDPSKALVATADGALLKDLQKGIDDYRRKEIFAFRGYNTDRLEFTRDGQTIVFEKVKAQGQTPEKWHRASPNGDPDAMGMENLVVKLESLRAASFVDSAARTGLDKPALAVYAKFEDGKKEERVSFSKVGADAYASVPGQAGAVKIATTDFDEMMKALDAVSK
jgi:Domain of unknown function (DUF4340)